MSTIAAACSSPPLLKKLEPSTGQPHDVIFVEGDDREFAKIVWDVGTTNERVIPGPFLGAYMFSVPDDAVPGNSYDVALENSAGRSSRVTFTVPGSPGPLSVPRPPGPPHSFPAPRIDAVTVIGAKFDTAGLHTTLYVQGANIDVGATVWVKGAGAASAVEVATVSHKVIRNVWYGVSGEELDYPIYHYSSAIIALEAQPPGETITLSVRNLGGAPSEEVPYQLPSDADTIDSDGDGLLDKWETSGYDANADGVVDIDLPTLGADPLRRDVFLELDIMDGVQFRPDRDKEGAPDSTVFDALRAMFEAAPIINVNGRPGIHLEIDHSDTPCLPLPAGGEKCSWQFTMFDTSPPTGSMPDPLTSVHVRFSKLKEENFKNDVRGKIYHYGIWAIQDDNDDSSGHSDFGDDFLISFDAFGPSYQTRRSQAERVAHELGHGLGLRHGGSDDLLYKPNYLSVMSYSWDLRTGWEDDYDRETFVTCLPFYYAKEKAEELNGVVPSDVNMIVDYSEGMARTLMKPATGATHFCGLPVDFATIFDTPAVTRSDDSANWRALKFDGPVKNGWLKP